MSRVMWKTKHPNLTILETQEDTPVLVCCVYTGDIMWSV